MAFAVPIIKQTNMDINQLIALIGSALGIGGGLGWLYNWRSNRKIAKMTAEKAMIDNYEARIAALHESMQKSNAMESEHLKRISELNHALDGKTDRIRELTDKLYDSEQEVNRVNDLLNVAQSTIANLERQLGEANVQKEHYKAWHCRKAECTERLPPNPTLKGMTYVNPQFHTTPENATPQYVTAETSITQ